MNISGPSIAAVLRQTVKASSSMIIVQDSLSHRPETLSVKFGGSANGHNGIKSVLSALGGDGGFYRFRIGIGRDQSDPAEYVLQKLSARERQFWSSDGGGLDGILGEIWKVAAQPKR
jgi:peptidyl-tRNA hydrolase, PTH1 family